MFFLQLLEIGIVGRSLRSRCSGSRCIADAANHGNLLNSHTTDHKCLLKAHKPLIVYGCSRNNFNGFSFKGRIFQDGVIMVVGYV